MTKSVINREYYEKRKSGFYYCNRDIFARMFAGNLKNRSFDGCGIKKFSISDVLPTNLPAEDENGLRLDNLLSLSDGTLALLDYETTYDQEDMFKYMEYITGLLESNWKYWDTEKKLRMLVIYSGNIRREDSRGKLELGCMKFSVEEIFLSELDADSIENNLAIKITTEQELTEKEEIQLILLPLIYQEEEKRPGCIRRCFEMAKCIKDKKQQEFLIEGLLVFTDKIVDEKGSEEIRRRIKMTKVGRMIQEEINRAVTQTLVDAEVAKEKEVRKAVWQAEQIGEKRAVRGIVCQMKEYGMHVEEIMNYVTGITQEEIEGIR